MFAVRDETLSVKQAASVHTNLAQCWTGATLTAFVVKCQVQSCYHQQIALVPEYEKSYMFQLESMAIFSGYQYLQTYTALLYSLSIANGSPILRQYAYTCIITVLLQF